MCGFRNEFWFAKLMAWTFFFMSFFFFKAGYFNKGIILDFRKYFSDRFGRLLIPYLVWGLIGSVIYFGFLYFTPSLHPSLSRLRWDHIYTMSHFYGNPPCWFLFSFFTAYIVIGIVNKLRIMRVYNILVLTFPFVSYYLYSLHNPLWMSLNNVFMGLFFFQLGHWWRRLQSHESRHSIFGIPFSRICAIVLSLLLIAEFVYFNRHCHGEYDMSLNKWVSNPWGAGINTTCALVGISGIMLMVLKWRMPIINYIGEHSMVFFVAHYPIIFFYRFSTHIAGHSIRHNSADCIILTLLILIICRLLVPYIEKVPWLSGRIKKS